jgi:hypothetical protein
VKRVDINLFMAYPPAPKMKKSIGQNPQGTTKQPTTSNGSG